MSASQRLGGCCVEPGCLVGVVKDQPQLEAGVGNRCTYAVVTRHHDRILQFRMRFRRLHVEHTPVFGIFRRNRTGFCFRLLRPLNERARDSPAFANVERSDFGNAVMTFERPEITRLGNLPFAEYDKPLSFVDAGGAAAQWSAAASSLGGHSQSSAIRASA